VCVCVHIIQTLTDKGRRGEMCGDKQDHNVDEDIYILRGCGNKIKGELGDYTMWILGKVNERGGRVLRNSVQQSCGKSPESISSDKISFFSELINSRVFGNSHYKSMHINGNEVNILVYYNAA